MLNFVCQDGCSTNKGKSYAISKDGDEVKGVCNLVPVKVEKY